MRRVKTNTLILVVMLMTSVAFNIDSATVYGVNLGEDIESSSSMEEEIYKREISIGGEADIKVYSQGDKLIAEIKSNKVMNYKDTNRGQAFDMIAEGTIKTLSILATEDILIEVIPKKDGKLNIGVTEYYEEIDRFIERRSVVFEEVDVKKDKTLRINLPEYTEKNKRDLRSGYEEYDEEFEAEVKKQGTDIDYRLMLSNGKEMKPSIDLKKNEEMETVSDNSLKSVEKEDKSNRNLIIFVATVFIVINTFVIRNLSKKINE